MTLTKILGLFKPDRTDNISVSRDIGQNMDILDDGYENLQGLIGIPQNGDTATKYLNKYTYIVRKASIAKTTDNINTNEELSGKVTPVFANGFLNWVMLTLRRFEFVDDTDGNPNYINGGTLKRFSYIPSANPTQMKLYLIFTTGMTEDYMSVWLWAGHVQNDWNPVVLPVAKTNNCYINVSTDTTTESTKNQMVIQNSGTAPAGFYIYKIGDRDN